MSDKVDLPALREAVAQLLVLSVEAHISEAEAAHGVILSALPALLDELEALRKCNDILRRNNLTLKDDSKALDVLRVEQRQLVERWNKANIEREDNAQRLVTELTKAEADLAAARAEASALRKAITTYCSEAVAAYLTTRDVAALAEAHAEDSQSVDKLEADLAAARAALDYACPILTLMSTDEHVVLSCNRAAWEAWQGRGRGGGSNGRA